MNRTLLVTGPCGAGKSMVAQQALDYPGWTCRLYDGLNPDTDWSLPVHPLAVELVVIDHVGSAPVTDVQSLVAWCQANSVSLMLVEQSRVTLEQVVPSVKEADELHMAGPGVAPKFMSGTTDGSFYLPVA